VSTSEGVNYGFFAARARKVTPELSWYACVANLCLTILCETLQGANLPSFPSVLRSLTSKKRRTSRKFSPNCCWFYIIQGKSLTSRAKMFPEPLSPARSNRSVASLIDALERVAVNFFRCFCKRHNHLEHAARALRANYCDSDRFNQNPRPRRQHRSKQGTGKLVCYLSPLNKVDNLPACSLAGSQQRRKQRKQRPNAFVP